MNSWHNFDLIQRPQLPLLTSITSPQSPGRQSTPFLSHHVVRAGVDATANRATIHYIRVCLV